MAQQRRALVRGMEPGPCQRSAHERPDRLAVRKAAARRPHPDQDLPCGAGRSALTEGGNYCFADLVRQWKAILARALAPDAAFPRVPLQIIQGEGRDFTRP